MLLCASCVNASAQAQQSADAPLTNSSIVKLVRAGFKEKTVIAIIRTRQTNFDLAPDRLIELKRGGVSENVILAMLARNEGVVVDNSDDFDERQCLRQDHTSANGSGRRAEVGKNADAQQ